MIIWLASYPRSGNSLFREVLWQLFGLRSCSVYNDPEAKDMHMENAVGHDIMYFKDFFEFEHDDKPHFVKTHEICDRPHDDLPAIYIVRDGRDTLVSQTHFTFEFGGDRFGYKDWNGVLEELCKRGLWNNHVTWWIKERPKKSRFAWIKFEDLVKNPVGTTMWACDQIDVPVKQTGDSLLSFDELNAKWPRFFRKGKIGAWTQEMPKSTLETFWAHNRNAMDLLGYK